MNCPTGDVVRRTPVTARIAARFAVVLALLWAIQIGWCQEDPFARDGVPAADRAATAGPADQAPQEQDQEKDANDFAAKAAAEVDPLVRAILQARPTTPERWIGDVQSLLNLNRPEFARQYLRQFLATNPEADELTQIQTRYGTSLFLRLSRIAEL